MQAARRRGAVLDQRRVLLRHPVELVDGAVDLADALALLARGRADLADDVVDALGVDIEGSDGTKGRFECGTTIWAAGVQASPLAGLLALGWKKA